MEAAQDSRAMLEFDGRVFGRAARRLQSCAALAAAIVPFAIIVHLAAEAAAVGRTGLDAGFMLRHAYFALMMAASIGWFSIAVGLGRRPAERRRRCALLRAELSCRRAPNVMLLIAANLGFFALSQGVEGVPLWSGTVVLGLGVAALGSLLAAVLVFVFAKTLAMVGLDSIIGVTPVRRSAWTTSPRDRGEGATQRVATIYSLFIPNRPPPLSSQF